jgi:hypothetical protein
MSIPNVEVHRQYAVKGTIFGKFLFEHGKCAYKKHLMVCMYDICGVRRRKRARSDFNIDRIELMSVEHSSTTTVVT